MKGDIIMKKIISILTISTLLLTTMSISTTAAEQNLLSEISPNDNAPAIGEFISDEEYAQLIAEKEQLGREYYEAICSGDVQTANARLESFKSFGQNVSTQSISTPNNFSANNFSTNSVNSDFKRIGALGQRKQETSNWCGYAAMESLLDHHYQNVTQTNCATYIKNYIETTFGSSWSTNTACPWYMNNGNSSNQFPVPKVLSSKINFGYYPYPYGAAGATAIPASEISWRVVATINSNKGLMVCGTSSGSSSAASHLPGYPNSSKTHWLAIDGYDSSGSYIYIIDPAAGSPAVSWGANLSPLSSVSATKLAAFATSRGLVW
jgi:hypothetical protein